MARIIGIDEARRLYFWPFIARLSKEALSDFRLVWPRRSEGRLQETSPKLGLDLTSFNRDAVDEGEVRFKADQLTQGELDKLVSGHPVTLNPDGAFSLSTWRNVARTLAGADPSNSASWEEFGFDLNRISKGNKGLDLACKAAWAAFPPRRTANRKGRLVKLTDLADDGFEGKRWLDAWATLAEATPASAPAAEVQAPSPVLAGEPAAAAESTKVVVPKRRAVTIAPLTNQALNLLLEGVPGTGKTHHVKQIVDVLGGTGTPENPVRGDGKGRFAITMHPATTYEEFVEGLRPATGVTSADRAGLWLSEENQPAHEPVHLVEKVLVPYSPGAVSVSATPKGAPTPWFWQSPPTKGPNEDAVFTLEDGFFLRACAEAVHFPEKLFVILLDEFNRCNIPKVMGDLLTTIEASKRATWNRSAGQWDVSDCPLVTLPGSGRLFFVPDNVIVVATMNSSDRSVGSIDAALRRRFAVQRIWPIGFGPDPARAGRLWNVISKEITDRKHTLPKDRAEWLKASIAVWHALNVELDAQFGPDGMLGHSYLIDMGRALAQPPESSDRRMFRGKGPREIVQHYWEQQIIPQLVEALDATHKHSLVAPKLTGTKERRTLNESLAKVSPPGAVAELLGFKLAWDAEHSSLLSRITVTTIGPPKSGAADETDEGEGAGESAEGLQNATVVPEAAKP